MILLSIQSPHVSEVKASIFAAGCFCLLSDDFACILLEILIDMISSLRVPSEVIFSAVRVFSKMQCSYSVATRAYKAGRKLVMGSLQEEFEVEMLSSLSILASKSILLYTEQVDLLLSYLSGEHVLTIKVRALRCLYYMLRRRGWQFPVNRSVLDKFFHIADDNDLPLNFQCEALRFLCKIFCSPRADITCMDMPDLLELAKIADKSLQSSSEEKKYLSIRLLAGILCSLKSERAVQFCQPWDKSYTMSLQSQGHPSLAFSEDGPEFLVTNLTSLIIGHVQSLVKLQFITSGGNVVETEGSPYHGKHLTIKKQCKVLLDLVFCLAKGYPSLVLVALDGISSVMETLKNHTSGLPQIEIVAVKSSCVLSHPNTIKDSTNVLLELIPWICRFVDTYLDILDETDVCGEVYKKVKLLVEHIQQIDSSGYAYEIFRLCMRFSIECPFQKTNDDSPPDVNQLQEEVRIGLLQDVCWVSLEWRTLEFTKRMLRRRNNWAAYRAGKYSCCKGLWFAATFSFRKLIDMIQTDSCRYWLGSLMLFSAGESEFKLLLFPDVGKELVAELQIESNIRKPFSHITGDECHCVDINANLSDLEGDLVRVYSRINSSEKILSGAGALDGVFYFQRWFLSLRAKVLETVVDFLGLVNYHTAGQEVRSTVEAQDVASELSSFAAISLRWSRLAKEYDFLATSFPDIDCKSFRIVSSLALNCSLLSFCATFYLYLPNSSADVNVMSCFRNLGKSSPALILRDLVERLSDMDEEATAQLHQLVTDEEEVVEDIQSRTHLNIAGPMEKVLLPLCKVAIVGVLRSREEAKGDIDEELYFHFMRGLQHISDIIRKWLAIPFETPKFFFRVRPCIGAELFIFNANSAYKRDIFCSVGSRLSLNLCVQIKNASKKPHVRCSKVYCILAATSSDQLLSGREGIEQMLWHFHVRNTVDMAELADLLLMYVKTDTKGSSSEDLVTACACFELNEDGQGFSSCLLDVSAFPEGYYPIKWHCCCFHENGSLWSLMPLNTGDVFHIKKS